MTSLRAGIGMLSAMATIATVALAASTAIAADKWPSYPRALQGIWFGHNAEGNYQCQAYKRADKTNGDEVSGLLVGAVLISDSMMHGYSEYGEGNFYELRRLEKTKRSSWHITVAIGIDSVPEPTQRADDIFTLQLTKTVLIVKTKTHLLNLMDSRKVDYKLRRCIDVPVGFYGRSQNVQVADWRF
jgi:hypothetical protein